MALETATYIDSLNVNNPVATDPLSQADEHIRLLKSTIKATFPNITGAVTSTQAELDIKTAITTNGSTPSLASGITGAEVKSLIGVVEPAVTTNGSTPSLASGITAAEVRSLIGAQATDTALTKLDVYPVGSVYISVLSTSPASLFGGTWVAIGQGRVLVGVDSTDSDFDTLGETGGAKTHTLTAAQSGLPSHSHTQKGGGFNGSVGIEPGNTLSQSLGETGTTGGTNASEAHNNLQPYLVVSMWKRTA